MSDVLIADIPKNATENIRVSLTEYKGYKLLDVRTYYQAGNDEWKPGKGITVRRDLIPELKEAIIEAERQDQAATV